jgi:hypothetical protein
VSWVSFVDNQQATHWSAVLPIENDPSIGGKWRIEVFESRRDEQSVNQKETVRTSAGKES